MLADVAYVRHFDAEVRQFAAEMIPTSPAVVLSMDAAVVFFEAFDGNELSEGSEARVDDAIALYRAGRVRDLFVVGGAREGRRPGSVLMADRLIREGVPAQRVAVDSASFDSQSNWREARRLARERGVDSLVLVSAAYHLRRLSRVAQDSALTLAFYARSHDRDSHGWGDRWLIAHREGLARAADALLPRVWHDTLIRGLRR